jgi:hypothetical protein
MGAHGQGYGSKYADVVRKTEAAVAAEVCDVGGQAGGKQGSNSGQVVVK